MKEIRLCDNADIDLTTNLCIENNLGIEIQAFHDPYCDKDKLLIEYKNVLPKIKGGRSLHAPFWELNLGTKMQGIRQETMNMFNYAYDIAKELGCTEIVVHNGYIPGTSWISGWVNRSVLFWQEFFKDKDDSIIMCLENQFEEDSEIMMMEVDQVNDPRLKICLDIGHANCNSNMKVEEWIKTLGNRIHYFHLHNNHGKQNIKGLNNDEHLGLTNGTINIEEVFHLAEEYCPDAIWNLECNTLYFDESIKALKDMGYLK